MVCSLLQEDVEAEASGTSEELRKAGEALEGAQVIGEVVEAGRKPPPPPPSPSASSPVEIAIKRNSLNSAILK